MRGRFSRVAKYAYAFSWDALWQRQRWSDEGSCNRTSDVFFKEVLRGNPDSNAQCAREWWYSRARQAELKRTQYMECLYPQRDWSRSARANFNVCGALRLSRVGHSQSDETCAEHRHQTEPRQPMVTAEMMAPNATHAPCSTLPHARRLLLSTRYIPESSWSFEIRVGFIPWVLEYIKASEMKERIGAGRRKERDVSFAQEARA